MSHTHKDKEQASKALEEDEMKEEGKMHDSEKGTKKEKTLPKQAAPSIGKKAAKEPIPEKKIEALQKSASAPATATIPKDINSSTTPAEMKINRIPPRVNTVVSASVASLAKGDDAVVFSFENNGGDNGTATINGAATYTSNASEAIDFNLSGTKQTKAGNVGKLKLVATQSGKQIAASDGFSISSVPQNWSTAYFGDSSDYAVGDVGVVVTNSWESDSGDLTDLDQVKRSEVVGVESATGVFAGAGENNSSWKSATSGSIQDNHAMPAASYKGIGVYKNTQTFKFKCDRMNVTDIPARNSGFKIERENTKSTVVGKTTHLHITKFGAAVTAQGIKSDAGSGNVDKGYDF